MQLIQHYSNGKKRIQFIDSRELTAVIITEAISFSSVHYHLAFVTTTKPDRLILAYEVQNFSTFTSEPDNDAIF